VQARGLNGRVLVKTSERCHHLATHHVWQSIGAIVTDFFIGGVAAILCPRIATSYLRRQLENREIAKRLKHGLPNPRRTSTSCMGSSG
jgi:hypothetical protein